MIAKEIRHITDMASTPYVREKDLLRSEIRKEISFLLRILQICSILLQHIRKSLPVSVIN